MANMSLSSDEKVKNEIVEKFGTDLGKLRLRIFPEESNEDQKLFSEGGLTFGDENVLYGSCDACWYVDDEEWSDPYTGKTITKKPIIALEGTDALNRGSSGNAQLQRFHHALGAVKSGIIGIYYLRKGEHSIYNALFAMAYHASQKESGIYLVTDSLGDIEKIIEAINSGEDQQVILNEILDQMKTRFDKEFEEKYGDWETFANRRSTIIKNNCVIKYAGRMKRNFTDGSQRAGHIAVGEMYLTKYFFPDKKFFYLWPKMTREDLEYLDRNKSDDKEWKLLRTEENVEIVTVDDLEGLEERDVKRLKEIKSEPLKGEILTEYNSIVNRIESGLREGEIEIKLSEGKKGFKKQKRLK